MEEAQNKLLLFLGDEENTEENYINLTNYLVDIKVQENRLELKEFLHLLFNILNNHQRSPNFFQKIERIVQYLKEDIKKYFDNSEIFNIFKKNKRILLFLFEEKIIEFDESIIKKFFINYKYEKYGYITYFLPEIKDFLTNINNKRIYKIAQEKTKSEKITEKFYEKRKFGENNHKICQIIRKDDIKEFISYIQQNNISLDSIIESSRYETNSFLIKIQSRNYIKISLIEYAAFFGSIQIFSYLKNEGVEMNPSLWKFAIHGNNINIINIIEENNIKPEDSFIEIFKEAIKCHHISIANYLDKKFIENSLEKSVIIQALKYHNYAFIKENQIDQSFLVYLCKYDYPIFVKTIFETSQEKGIKANTDDIL